MTYFKTKFQTIRAFSLAETIIYVAIIGFFFAVTINNIIIITRSHKGLAVTREIEQSAITSLDRIAREIRSAASIVSAQSTLGSHPSVLSLSVRDDSTNDYDTIQFSLSDGNLILTKNSVSQGQLNSSAVSVNNLVFTQIALASSTAVKIEIGFQATSSEGSKEEKFYHTVILRESYFDM